MYDPSTPYNDPNLTAAQTSADNAANTAVQYQSASSVLPNLLKTAINEKIDYNKGLIEAKNKSMVDYFNAPSAARLQYQDIFNPFQREALVEQAKNNAYLPYANNQDALTQRMGSLTDIINAATGAFGAQSNAAQGAASLAQNKYQNLFSLAGAKSSGLAAQQSQKNWEYEQTHAKPSSAAPKSKIEQEIEDEIWRRLHPNGDGNGVVPTETPPTYSPGKIGTLSKGGQYIYAKDPDTGMGEWMVNLGYNSAATTQSNSNVNERQSIVDKVSQAAGGI